METGVSAGSWCSLIYRILERSANCKDIEYKYKYNQQTSTSTTK